MRESACSHSQRREALKTVQAENCVTFMDMLYQWTKQVASHFAGTRNGTINVPSAEAKD